jgi:hypothetical protein
LHSRSAAYAHLQMRRTRTSRAAYRVTYPLQNGTLETKVAPSSDRPVSCILFYWPSLPLLPVTLTQSAVPTLIVRYAPQTRVGSSVAAVRRQGDNDRSDHRNARGTHRRRRPACSAPLVELRTCAKARLPLHTAAPRAHSTHGLFRCTSAATPSRTTASCPWRSPIPRTQREALSTSMPTSAMRSFGGRCTSSYALPTRLVPCDNRPTWPCLLAVPSRRAASLALYCTSALRGRSRPSRCTVTARIRVGNGTASHGKP